MDNWCFAKLYRTIKQFKQSGFAKEKDIYRMIQNNLMFSKCHIRRLRRTRQLHIFNYNYNLKISASDKVF